MKVPLGDWGESFYVSEGGRFGVTDCNGDRVELDADQWRRVVTLLEARLSRVTRRQTVPGRMSFEDRWRHFNDEELHAISSALWTTSELYPGRLDRAVMVALRGETTPIVKRREARAHQTSPGSMTLTTLQTRG